MNRKFQKTISLLIAFSFLLSLSLTSAFAGNIDAGKVKKITADPPDKSKVTYTAGELKTKSKPGELLVRFKNGKNMSDAGAQAEIAQLGGKVAKQHKNAGNIYLMEFDKSADLTMTAKALLANPNVEFAEPNYELKALEALDASPLKNAPAAPGKAPAAVDDQLKIQPVAGVNPLLTPNDPMFSQLWGMNNDGSGGGVADMDINAPEAWNTRTNASSVIVAVLDTGVDYNHEDLSANKWVNTGEIPNNGIDDDGNGYVDDYYGWNFAYGNSNPWDDNGHGTHVAGTIGAVGNNAKGVAGVCWNVKIMPLKFLNSSGSGWTEDAIEALNYLVMMRSEYGLNIRVVNNSWGGGGYSNALQTAFNILKSVNILPVCAAGNDALDADQSPMYPAAYKLDNIVSVAAMDKQGKPAYFTNWGISSVDLAAPGVSILSSVPGNNYASYSGTSMATPHVSGVAALTAAHYSLNWQQLKGRLLNSVKLLNEADWGNKRIMTMGMVRADTALASVSGSRPAIFNLSPSTFGAGDTITINGYNFGASGGTVYFGATAVTVPSGANWTNTRIKVTAPAGMTANPPSNYVVVRKTVSSVNYDSHRTYFRYGRYAEYVDDLILPVGWATGATVNNLMYIIGGETPLGFLGLVQYYNPATGETMITSRYKPTPTSNSGAAAIGAKIYVAGGMYPVGNQNIVTDKVEVFDTATRTWSSIASLPQPLLQPGVTALGAKLYVIGGLNAGFSALKTTYVFDTANPALGWVQKADLPAARAYAGARASGSTIYILGGFTSASYGSETDTMYTYNTGTDAWSTSGYTLPTKRAGAACPAYGLHVAGGSTVASNGSSPEGYGATSVTSYYSGFKNIFILNVGRYTPAAGYYNPASGFNWVYTLGGYNAWYGMLYPTIERYNLAKP